MTQAVIPEGFAPLVVLPGLGLCSFPLTLIIRVGDSKMYTKESSESQTWTPYLHCGAADWFPLGHQDQSPQPAQNSHFLPVD